MMAITRQVRLIEGNNNINKNTKQEISELTQKQSKYKLTISNRFQWPILKTLYDRNLPL